MASWRICARGISTGLLRQIPLSNTARLIKPITLQKSLLSTTSVRFSSDENEEEEGENGQAMKGHDPKDRTREIPLELSIEYMKSIAYKATYGDSKIWELYRRNYSGVHTYRDTRLKCIHDGRITTGNPCPICRDEYLVVDYRNTDLIKQFITDYSGKVRYLSRFQSSYKVYRMQVAIFSFLLDSDIEADRRLPRAAL